jgi:hypothetical protein
MIKTSDHLQYSFRHLYLAGYSSSPASEFFFRSLSSLLPFHRRRLIGFRTNFTAMPLPTFRSLAARRNSEPQKQEETSGSGGPDGVVGQKSSSEGTLTGNYQPGVNVKLATQTRRNWIIISCVVFLISVIFLILVFLPSASCQTF